jgi:hypothetical protein
MEFGRVGFGDVDQGLNDLNEMGGKGRSGLAVLLKSCMYGKPHHHHF